MMEFKKIIKDPIHGYIGLTKLELQLLNEVDVFERLKDIAQLGMAYQVYPSAIHNRYEHSLGTMHNAGKMIQSILNKKETNSTIRNWLEDWKSALKKLKNLEYEGTEITNLRTTDIDNLTDDEFIIQFVRILALLHDIGHLSLSHTFEFGFGAFYKQTLPQLEKDTLEIQIEDFLGPYNLFDMFLNKTKYQGIIELEESFDLHEKIGHKLILSNNLNIKPILEEHFGEGIGYIINTIYEFPEDIYAKLTESNNINTKEEIENFIGSKHNIEELRLWYPLLLVKELVAGNLDADRLDYVSRDINRSGLTIGEFDITRIFDNLTIVRYDEHSAYRLAVSLKGISGVESFYLQRYFCYKWLYGHHIVRLMDRMVEFAIHYYLQEIDEKNSIINKILNLEIFDRTDKEEEFNIQFDDNFLREKLLNLRETNLEEAKLYNHAYISNIRTLVDTILYRKNMPIALWKSWYDFKTYFLHSINEYSKNEDLINNLDSEVETFLNDNIQFSTSDISYNKYSEQTIEAIYIRKIEKRLKQLFNEEPLWIWTQIREHINIYQSKISELAAEKIEIVNLYFVTRKSKTYSKLDILILDNGSENIVDLSQVSPLISSLLDPYYDDPLFYIYIQFENRYKRNLIKGIGMEGYALFTTLKEDICKSIANKIF